MAGRPELLLWPGAAHRQPCGFPRCRSRCPMTRESERRSRSAMPSVPVIRARETLWNSGPNTGGFRISLSHLRRPSSVAIHFRSPMIPTTMTAMINRTHGLVMMVETSMSTCVGNGSFPPRVLKRFWKTGTMKTIMAVKMHHHHRHHHRRIGHGRPDGPVELGLLLDGVGQTAQHLVEVSAYLSGLDRGCRTGARRPWGAWSTPPTATSRARGRGVHRSAPWRRPGFLPGRRGCPTNGPPKAPSQPWSRAAG